MMQENSVQCTCRGFQLTDVIKFCQKFRTHSLSDVSARIKDIPCMFCVHPLQDHSPVSSQDSSFNQDYSDVKPLGVYENLTLRNSSKLSFFPINSNCLELMVPRNIDDHFLLLSISKPEDADTPSLAVLSQPISPGEGEAVSLSEEVEEESLPSLEENVVVEEGAGSRKRSKRTHPVADGGTRKSRRLASKRAREEERKVLRQLKGLKGVGRWMREVEMRESDAAEEGDLTDQEVKQVMASIVSFMKSMDAPEGYQIFTLPQVCRCIIMYMCIHMC